MDTDLAEVDPSADQRSQGRICLGVAGHIQALVGQVADARGKTEAQKVHQREDMVGEASSIGVVLLDA